MKRHSPLLVSLLAALVAAPAAAQNSLDTVLYNSGQTVVEINAESCTAGPGGAPEELEFQYVVNFATLGGLIMRVHAHPQTRLQPNQQDGCNTPAGDDFDYPVFVDRDLRANDPIDVLISVEDITRGACAEPARGTAGSLCFHLVDSLNNNAVQNSIGFNLDFDTIPPATPALDWQSGDGEVTLSLSGVAEGRGENEPYTYFIQYRACVAEGGDAGPTTSGDAGTTGASVAEAETLCDVTPGDFTEIEVSSTNTAEDGDVTRLTLGNLSNDAEYEVRVFVSDDLGNVSDVSTAKLVKPQQELSPLSVYRGDGSPFSTTPPNCAEAFGMTGPWFLALALVAGAWWRRRRRATGFAALAVLLVPATLLFADASHAKLGQATVDLRVSPWVPDVDSGAGTTVFFNEDGETRRGGMYECYFDGAFFDGSQVIPELGVNGDIHLLDVFGSLQLGMGMGFSQVAGKTRSLSSRDARGNFLCGAAQTGSVELTLIKFRPGLTYRFDPLLDLWDIPLVPYGRFGLTGVTYLWTRDGAFDDGAPGVNPVGMVFGWDASVGMMLALDFWDYIDPFAHNTTKRARALGTFNHAFFFTELQVSQIDNFGRQNGWVFSPRDDLFGTGLPFQMHFGLAVEFL